MKSHSKRKLLALSITVPGLLGFTCSLDTDTLYLSGTGFSASVTINTETADTFAQYFRTGYPLSCYKVDVGDFCSAGSEKLDEAWVTSTSVASSESWIRGDYVAAWSFVSSAVGYAEGKAL